MNISYTSLDDLYETQKETKKTTNNYDNIIKNLIQANKRKNITYEIPDPITPPSIPIFSPYSQQPKEVKKEVVEKEVKKVENNISLDKNIKEKFTNKIGCQNFLKHLTKCEKCRNYILDTLKKKHEENNIMKEELLDISIFVLSGIFVLFLVDSFINLGKLLK